MQIDSHERLQAAPLRRSQARRCLLPRATVRTAAQPAIIVSPYRCHTARRAFPTYSQRPPRRTLVVLRETRNLVRAVLTHSSALHCRLKAEAPCSEPGSGLEPRDGEMLPALGSNTKSGVFQSALSRQVCAQHRSVAGGAQRFLCKKCSLGTNHQKEKYCGVISRRCRTQALPIAG